MKSWLAVVLFSSSVMAFAAETTPKEASRKPASKGGNELSEDVRRYFVCCVQK